MKLSTCQLIDAFPYAFQVLLPQRHLTIATTHSQNITRQTPGYTPNHIRELARCNIRSPRRRRRARSGRRCHRRRVQRGLDPRLLRSILRPYDDRPILGRSRQVRAGEANVWCPCDVAHPVGVSRERLFLDPAPIRLAVPPDTYNVVASGARKALDCLQGAGPGCRCTWLAGRLRGEGGRDERTGENCWCPGYGITSDSVAVEDVGIPRAIIFYDM